MALTERLMDDLKEAMRGGDTVRRETIRLVRAAIKNAEIERGRSLTDEEVLGVLTKQARQREESIVEFTRGNRPDLVAREEAELAVIRQYLPQPVSREEIEAAARRIIAEVGARGPGDVGKVMPRLMAELRGRVDGRQASTLVNELLRSLG